MTALDMTALGLARRHHRRLVNAYREYLASDSNRDSHETPADHERMVIAYSEGVEHALETVALEIRRGRSS